eukprot:4211553-Pyramimonas_sp.AAC.1
MKWTDPRAAPFIQTLMCIRNQANRPKGRFKAFCLENVLGMLDASGEDDGASAAHEVLEWLRQELGTDS